ncbi:MAG: DM13 domain-containing protein [Myxococcota bacterium]
MCLFKSVCLSAVLAAAALTSASAEAAEVVRSGKFEGRSDHATRGGVSIVKTNSGMIVLLESDFFQDGAPDPTIGFGMGGKFDKASQFSPLKNTSGEPAVKEAVKGAAAYVLPARIDLSKYDEIYIWCEEFSVPLGVAKLK